MVELARLFERIRAPAISIGSRFDGRRFSKTALDRRPSPVIFLGMFSGGQALVLVSVVVRYGAVGACRF